MARPLEFGLKSVKLPLDYFDQPSVMLAREDIDPEGQNTFIRFAFPYVSSLLVKKIFQNSYFLEWNDFTGLDLVRSAGSPLSLGEAERIINCLSSRGFFDNNLWITKRVLTSTSIQNIWKKEMKSLKRMGEINPKYELKDIAELV